MDNIDIQIFRTKDIVMVDGDNFFVVFDCKSGADLKPILCFLSFCPDWRFFQELALFDFIDIDVESYFVRGGGSTVLLLQPLRGYTNQKMEDLFCSIIRRYEVID